MGKESQAVEFSLEGQFLGFAIEEGYKLKSIRLATPSGEYVIKLPKELRSFLYRALVPGSWIQVTGHQKVNLFKGTRKLKAHQIRPIGQTKLGQTDSKGSSIPVQTLALSPASPIPFDRSSAQPNSKKRSAQDTILVCQKSDCCKRGANALMRALQAELDDRGLTEQVKIRGTGCMKQCKAGPALVMPDKSRYTRLCPNQVSALVEQHFPGTKEIAS